MFSAPSQVACCRDPIVVVVGAGVIGCAIARELATRGVRARSSIRGRPAAARRRRRRGCSRRMSRRTAAADARPLRPQPGSLRRLDRGSPRRRAPRSSTAASARWKSRSIADHAAALRSADTATGWSRGRRAPRSATGADARRAAERSPRLRRRAQLDAALAQSAGRHGATFVSARVERIERARHRRSSRSRTERDALDADAVVLAAGAWTNRIHGVRTPPLARCADSCCTCDWGHGRVCRRFSGDPTATSSRASTAPRARRRHRRARRLRRAHDRGRRERPARGGPDAAAGARETELSTPASACVPRRPTNCRCSATIPPSPASSTRQATTATASCSRRSRRS